jgi:putative spermidine/putrescine transport system permease protein
VVAFLLLPILAVVPASFNHTSFIRLPPERMSLRWYQAFFADADWLHSLWTSLEVAVLATTLAVTLGALAAIGLERCAPRVRALILGLVLSPLIVPVIMTAIALYYVCRPLGLHGTILGLALGHTLLCLPFAVINVGVSLKNLDPTLLRAADGMGAGPWYVFRTVTLPIVMPGLAGGAAFAFITSFDEVVVVLQMATAEQRTIPRQMFSGIREQISPTILAVATILVIISIMLLTTVELLRRRSERLRGMSPG